MMLFLLIDFKIYSDPLHFFEFTNGEEFGAGARHCSTKRVIHSSNDIVKAFSATKHEGTGTHLQSS